MNFETIASIVGLSSVISVCINIIFEFIGKKRMIKFEKSIQEKEHRYRSTLAFMLIVLDYNNLYHVDLSGVTAEFIKDLSVDETRNFFLDEVKAHFAFSHLYAADDVLRKMKAFIDHPTDENYQKTAQSMRKDLWI